MSSNVIQAFIRFDIIRFHVSGPSDVNDVPIMLTIEIYLVVHFRVVVYFVKTTLLPYAQSAMP